MSQTHLNPEKVKGIQRGVTRLAWVMSLVIGCALFWGLLPNQCALWTGLEEGPLGVVDFAAPAGFDMHDTRVENGIHIASGLIADDQFPLIQQHCFSCHSGRLIAQNRMDREGWTDLIRWMQETQNLWKLGADEPGVLDYLERNYAPQNTGRRANLDTTEWYELD